VVFFLATFLVAFLTAFFFVAIVFTSLFEVDMHRQKKSIPAAHNLF
jgi:hypothetical protein